jgi:hypothetical protein
MSCRTLLLTIAASLAQLAPAGASAQCRLCDSPTTAAGSDTREGPLDLRVEAALDFDQLILMGAGEGSAKLRPDGTTHVDGMIGAISNRAMVGTATVRGEPGRAVRIELPPRIELYSLSGGQLAVDEITSDLPDMAKLDSSGSLVFRFGGRVRITGDAEGDYRGELPITAEYL